MKQIFLLLMGIVLGSCGSSEGEDIYNENLPTGTLRLSENGVTVICDNCDINYIGELNGKKYVVLESIFSLVRDGEDLSNFQFESYDGGGVFTIHDNVALCTSLITNLIGDFTDPFEIIGDISSWDVSNVTDMSYLFYESSSTHNLSNWDVSSVENLTYTFANSSFNGFVNNWELSSLTDMSSTFYNSRLGSNVDISGWDVSNVSIMRKTFHRTYWGGNVGISDLSNWNVGNVTSMSKMFFGNQSLDLNISSWDVSSVTTMEAMFASENVGGFPRLNNFNQDISSWDISSLQNAKNMFYDNREFNQDLSSWNFCNVTERTNYSYGTVSWDLPKPSLNCK